MYKLSLLDNYKSMELAHKAVLVNLSSIWRYQYYPGRRRRRDPFAKTTVLCILVERSAWCEK